MQDKLEKFIKENRQLLDDKTPDGGLWSKIEQEIDRDRKKKRVDFTFLWKAAAIFFLGVSGYLFYQLNNSEANRSSDLSTAGIMKEFEAAEAFYIAEISEKRANIEAINDVNQHLAQSFQEDIHKLDSMYGELKKELFQDNNEQVFNALIQNLQIRIEILNQQLNILEQVKKSKKDEKVNI
ncbi:hypothetical protein QQ020_18520 [Fulvivirgaceae bacterium BMA12]|uniref:Anti-sigma factor n=1 Tax=Agaribacillus aureus TaxID=3051825 RepID=A0ABT8L8J0_9BACT|nr:hypothetical protein [Fulvivirgaceae bacterium BMA12]